MIVIAITGGLLVGGAVIARQLWLNDHARAIDTGEALRRFRDHSSDPNVSDPNVSDPNVSDPNVSEPSVTAPVVTERTTNDTVPATLPALGVYRYTTSGSEHIDVLGGTRHEYPKQTTVTVTTDACGVNLRWDLLRERWEDWRLCIGVGVGGAPGVVWQAQGGHFYHEFFGHGQMQTLTCDRPALLVPLDKAPRAVVPLECQLDTEVWQPQWTVIGPDTRTVAGVPVPVTHVRMVVDLNRTYYEHTTMDYWLDAHGLPVHIAGTKTSKSDSGLVGDVIYTETISADLDALEPLR